jgi:hypothetical protein
MEIYDSLNNQFKLCNYIAKLNIELLQYLENNNININYYCFFSKIIDNKHYIITSQTTGRALNGYRLITIQDINKDNNIFAYNDSINIIFENIHINVTSVIDDVSDVFKNLSIVIKNFNSKSVKNETIDCLKYYDKNILESKIIKITNVDDLIILNNFENLKELTFDFYYNQIISANVLPNSLQALTFNYYYNQIIGVNVLPNSLQTLTFNDYYNQIIDVNVLPNSLHTLTFGGYYNQIIGVNVLPNSLHTLTFGFKYNQKISINVLPNSLQVIYFNLHGSLYNDEKCKNHIIPQAFQNIIKYTGIKN